MQCLGCTSRVREHTQRIPLLHAVPREVLRVIRILDQDLISPEDEAALSGLSGVEGGHGNLLHKVASAPWPPTRAVSRGASVGIGELQCRPNAHRYCGDEGQNYSLMRLSSPAGGFPGHTSTYFPACIPR